MRGQFSCQLEEYKELIAAGQKDAHTRRTPSRSEFQINRIDFILFTTTIYYSST